MKTSPRKYVRDELSSMFPDMDEDEFECLKKDIQDNGLLDNIVASGNRILDGWHRYRAVTELGIFDPDMVEQYNPDWGDEKAYVLTRNLYRRQLAAEDRARLVAEQLGYTPSRGKPKAGSVTAAQVAKVAGVSERTVRTAVKEEKPKKEVTIEGLQKRERMLVGQLENVRAQIAELQSIAKPEAKPGRVLRRK